MGFSRKRGRPKIERAAKDRGTRELQQKRLMQTTQEALDLCLIQNLITDQQHSCGLRLRWLYTLQFGAPSIEAYVPESFGGGRHMEADEEWLELRKNEYYRALRQLEVVSTRKLVLNICVFNQRIGFLGARPQKVTFKEAAWRHHSLLKFREGLRVLEEVFGKK